MQFIVRFIRSSYCAVQHFILWYILFCLLIVSSQQKLPWNIWTLDTSLEKSASWSLMVCQCLFDRSGAKGNEMEQKSFKNGPFFPFYVPIPPWNDQPSSVSLVLVLSVVARSASVPTERLDAVRKLAASLHCPLLFAEDQVCIPHTNCFKPKDVKVMCRTVEGKTFIMTTGGNSESVSLFLTFIKKFKYLFLLAYWLICRLLS